MLKLVISTNNSKWAAEIQDKAIKIFEKHNLPFEVFTLSPSKTSKAPLQIKINDIVLHKGQGISKIQLEKQLIKYILENVQLVQKIIVPIDFSEPSINALKYALLFAQSIHAKISVCHIVTPLINEVYPIPPLMDSASQSSIIENSESQLEKIINKLNFQERKLIENKKVIMGYPEGAILDFAQSENANLILMGSSGQNTILNKVLGSVSSSIGIRSKYPVLVVPPKLKFNSFQNILFSYDGQSATVKSIQLAIHWANFYSSKLKFIHVSPFSPFDATLKELLFKKMKNKIAIPSKYKFDIVLKDDPVEGIYECAQKEEADLIIVVNKKRNFWERITQKSISKSLLRLSKVPLLILHKH